VTDGEGSILLNRRLEELAGATASTCDPSGRLLSVSEGWLKVFDVSGQADPPLIRKHWIAGGPSRLMATPDGDLYVVGMAAVGGKHVFLRRFRLSDGEFLGIPQVDLPFKSAAGFNSFAINGGLVWNDRKQEAAFFAANPAKLWRMKGEGRAHATLPQSLAFRDAQVDPENYGQGNWQSHDWIRNATQLADGRIVAQVFRGRDNPPPEGETFAYLFVLNPEYEVVADRVPQEFMGLLSGSDDAGNLYFVDLLVNSGGTVIKARLEP
jgi:hypothetical protein